MSDTIRLTAAQAMVKWLSVQMNEEGERFIEGVWAIFGHGNVAGLGEALHGIGDAPPTMTDPAKCGAVELCGEGRAAAGGLTGSCRPHTPALTSISLNAARPIGAENDQSVA